MGMHEISQKLAYMTKPNTWEPVGDFTEAELTKLRFDAANELRHSTLGKELFARGGPYVFDDVLTEFATRVKPPSISPFVETLVQVARDILVTLPAEPEIPSEPTPTAEAIEHAKRVQAAQEEATRKVAELPRLKKFAYLVNRATQYGGIQCIKVQAGAIRLKFVDDDGKPREYESRGEDQINSFRKDYEAACAAGEIR